MMAHCRCPGAGRYPTGSRRATRLDWIILQLENRHRRRQSGQRCMRCTQRLGIEVPRAGFECNAYCHRDHFVARLFRSKENAMHVPTSYRRISTLGLLGLLMLLPVAGNEGPLQKPSDSAPASGPGASPIAQQPDRDQETKELRKRVENQKAELERQRRELNGVINYLIHAPEGEGQTEDYAQARASFETKLLRKGPAPGAWEPVKPPKGVTEVEYPSGELRLKALVNRPADESGTRPAVLFLHGGYAFDMSDWDSTKPYRDVGFVVMTPILRGENGQPGYFSAGINEVDDALAAAEHLSKQPYVDKAHIFLAGASAG